VKIKNVKIPEQKMLEAEIHMATASGLVVGASKVLTDFIGQTSWSIEISIFAARKLLDLAESERKKGLDIYQNPNLNPFGARRTRPEFLKPVKSKK
jgi:hypothetical protein